MIYAEPDNDYNDEDRVDDSGAPVYNTLASFGLLNFDEAFHHLDTDRDLKHSVQEEAADGHIRNVRRHVCCYLPAPEGLVNGDATILSDADQDELCDS